VDAYDDGAYGDSPYTGSYTVNSDGTFTGSFAGSYSVFTMTGVLENGTAEMEFTYDESGVGGVVSLHRRIYLWSCGHESRWQ
jgi:hypothetical protein